MQISGRPLLATRVDQPLYLARTADEHVLTAVQRGLNALVLGSPGSGKTSLLHHLDHRLREAGGAVCYVDGRRARGLAELLDQARRGLSVKAPPNDRPLAWLADAGLASPSLPSAEHTLDQLAHALPPEGRAVVLVDGPDPAVAHGLFGQLRDVVWQVPAAWVVAADQSVEPELRRAPADAFFDVVERLGAFDIDQSLKMLRQRGVSAQQARAVASLGQGSSMPEQTPRAVLDRARRLLLDQLSGNDLRRREEELQRRLGILSRAAGMLAAEIRSTGAVSASDPELQRRMGWTRARLTQVLKELESAGIVRATEASDGRAGRPRRFYELLEP